MKPSYPLLSILPFLFGFAMTASAATEYVFREALYSGSSGSRGSGRSAIYTDPIAHQMATTGKLKAPKEGDVAGEGPDGEPRLWQRIEVNEEGDFNDENLRGGYLFFTYDSPRDQTVILHSNSTSTLWVNGEPRAGDYYGKSWLLVPTKMKKGRNEIWANQTGRRNKGLRLTIPDNPIFLSEADMTYPDLLTNQIDEKMAAIQVINATDEILDGLRIVTNVAGQVKQTRVDQTITPLTFRRIPFKLADVASGPGKQDVSVRLLRDDVVLDEIVITLEVREPQSGYRRTFFSNIDGSLQYYGVRQGTSEIGKNSAMILSVHGAGVKGIGQARSYQSKDWAHVVAPTNRREFGFDWEDWGRIDAMEVLADAEELLGTDPERTYLTGHSMGGHGTWYLGATYPDRWAAISPMAGWRSFFSYGGLSTTEAMNPMEQMFHRAQNPSRTMEMLHNYSQHGVFIEHGDADRTVPVEEARYMREKLGAFHHSLGYFEEPGGGHWYGVDHDRAIHFMKRHERTDIRDLETLNFRSVNPGVSSTSRYITLYQQEHAYEFCGVVAEQTVRSRRQRRFDEDINERDLNITTDNLQIFKVDLAHCDGYQRVALTVDDQLIDDLPWPAQKEVWLQRSEDQWEVIATPTDLTQKNPLRYGGFKEAFNHRFVLVYATGGSHAENDAAYAKARFDAETFHYRGNGAMDVIPDHAFTLDGYEDRSVIIYGNQTTNQAWSLLLADSPVQVESGRLRIGQRTLSGDDMGIYMVRPRPDSTVASVGVVAGTGAAGFRAVSPNRYFVAGTGYPDLMVVSPDLFEDGIDGVVAAGYFGNDWSVENGDIVWAK